MENNEWQFHKNNSIFKLNSGVYRSLSPKAMRNLPKEVDMLPA